MEPKLIDFSVIKQKIIKTDEVLQMYMENNKKLKKTQQAYKDLKSKYEEASSGLNRFQLESDRCTFNLQHITSKLNKLESENKHLEQQNKLWEQKHCKHIMDSQTAILDLENEMRMIKELNESAEKLSLSPKKKLGSKDEESPKKIKELEESVKNLKQNEARFKQENDKLFLERKELVGDMTKMRNEHSKMVVLLQEEKNKLVIDLKGLKSQMASKQTHYNDVLLAKDKEISKLNAEVLALRGLKEQLKYLKEENKKLHNDIRLKDIDGRKDKLPPCRAAQTQTTQDIKSVLEENALLKTEMKMYKCLTLKCESTQTDTDEKYESLEEIFEEMIKLPRMLSPLPDEQLNASTTPLPQPEGKYCAGKDHTKEKSDPGVVEDESIIKPPVVQVPFVMKEERFGYVSDNVGNYETKTDILICEDKTYEASMTSGLKTENVIVGDAIDSKLFAADVNISIIEIERRQCTKEYPQLEAKKTLPTAVNDANHELSLSLTGSKENLVLSEASDEESRSFKNELSIHVGDSKEHPQLESELSFSIAGNQLHHLSLEGNTNLPLLGASVGDSQEFKNQPSMNELNVKRNPHLEAASPLSKANDQHNGGIDSPSMDNKENLPLFDASMGESQKIENKPSTNDVDIKENPRLDGESTLSTADNYLCHRLGLFEHDGENIHLSEDPVGDSQRFENEPSINLPSIKENPQYETVSIVMDNKENLPLFDASNGESPEIEYQPSIDDADIKGNPQFDCKSTFSTADDQLYPRFSLLSVDNEKNLPLFEDPVGDSQGFTKQPSINVPSVIETSQLEDVSTLSTANNRQNHGIALPSMDNKENLPLLETPAGESQELENRPSKIEANIREDSEPVASGSSDKKSNIPQRRRYRLSSKVSVPKRPCFRGHPPASTQMFRKEMRMKKCRRVDSVLRALQVLKRSKINFTISNESTLPVHWKDPNWLDRFSGAPADFGQPPRRTRVKNPARNCRQKLKQSTRKLSCSSKACKSVCMSLENRCGTANLLGFFNVKQEAVSPLGEPLDKKPDDPMKWLSDSLHSDKTTEALLEKLAELVSEKLRNDRHSKRKRPVSPPSEFFSETETELERLIEEPGFDVLERNKMLLKRAKYDLGRDSTSVTSLDTGDTKNSVGTPPFADRGLETEQLEAATTYQKRPDLLSPPNPTRKRSLPAVVTKTAVRALWNKPAPKEELPGVTPDIFENADSCDSYKFPVCPNLLSPLSSCAADSPKIGHFNLTPKKEGDEINFKTPEKKELASICKLEQKPELLSPIRKIDELSKLRSPFCKSPLGAETRLLHTFEIKLDNSRAAVKTEASRLEMVKENASATVKTSESGHLKGLEKTALEKLGCSGTGGLYTDGSPKKPIAQPERPITPLTANNSPGVEPHKQPSTNPSGNLKNTSPPASTTHRSFQLLNCSNLRQYSNRSKNRRALTNPNGNSKENYTLSSVPAGADPKRTPHLTPFVCRLKAEAEVGPPDGQTAIEGKFPLSQSSPDKTGVLSQSLRDVDIQEMDPSSPTRGSFIDLQKYELHNAGILNASCINDFLADENQITKEIESFMTKFGMDRSFTQAATLQSETTDINLFETVEKTAGVSRKISASDILDILPRSEEAQTSYEEEEDEEVPSCPLPPERQSDLADFFPKVIPLGINLFMDTQITDISKTDTLFADIPATYTAITGIPITDASVTETPTSEALSRWEKQEGKEVASCPQSPELQSTLADFAPKVIPLERNLFMVTPITDISKTDTLITDIPATYTTMTGIPITDTSITPTSEVLSRYEKPEGKEVVSCPQSPELQPSPADFVPKVIPLERDVFVDTPITDISKNDTLITDIPATCTTMTGIPITDTSITPTSEVLSRNENQEEKEVASCPQSPELQSPLTDFVPRAIPLERNLIVDTSITGTPITDTPITDTLITDTLITDISMTHTTITGIITTDSPITGTPRTYTSITSTPVTGIAPIDTPITGTPITGTSITDTPRTFTSITSTPVTGSAPIDIPITGTPITSTPVTGIIPADTSITGTLIAGTTAAYTSITSTSVTGIAPIDTPITGTPITGTSITDTPRTFTSITSTPVTAIIPANTSITGIVIAGSPIAYSSITSIPITDIPVSDPPVTKQKIKKGASASSAVTKGESKVTQRRSKRLSKAVISSSSETESEEDVCERLKESPSKVPDVDNTAAEQVKRKRGRPRIFPPKEISVAEKVVRKRGRPRKYPVQEASAEELESKRSYVEPEDVLESNEEKTDVADNEEGQKPAENCPSVSPKKVVKPKQKISKLKSNVLRQMKLKQKMFRSDKPGANVCSSNDCDVERNEATEAYLDRLSAETNYGQYAQVVDGTADKSFQSNIPGSNFCSNNDQDVKRNDLIEANLEVRNDRSSAEFNNSRYEKLASDPDKRITVVQNIVIRAGHSTVTSSGSNVEASSSRNAGDAVPKKCGRTKKSCDILSRIMGDMDKDRPKLSAKKPVAPMKPLPQGLDDKQWRKGILEIAEITQNKEVEVKENSAFLGQDAKTDSGLLNRGIEMPGKIKFLLKKLMKMSNEDEIPDHVITEFKKLQVDIIVDVIIREVAQDFVDKPDTKHFPAPLMTKTQRIYLALMLKLEQKKVEQLIDKFLVRSKHYILKRGCGLKAAIPLTRLIVGVCRIRADIHAMRMFCCDAFFFIGDLAVPILFTVLTSWIEVIPMEADVKNYPMAKVLVQLVHLKTFSKPGYNLYALRCLLSQFYGYPKERSNCDTLFEEVFHEYLRNPSASSDMAIRLFCRNKDTKWVYKKINEFFKPLIYKIPTENENFKATTILLLGKICRQFRLKEEHDRACLAEMSKFFTGLLEDDVTDLVKRSVSLTLDRLPKEKIKIRREEKQGDSKAAVNESSRIVRKNMTKSLPNPNWGYQNNRIRKEVRPKRTWTSKKKAPHKGGATKVSNGE